MLLFFGHAAGVSGSTWLVRALDGPWLIAVDRAQPVFAGLILGLLASGRLGIPRWRAAALGLCLLAGAAILVLEPVVSGPPPSSDLWSNGVCHQTSSASCGPAAAATVLEAAGISARESTLIAACRTTRQGTSFAGLVAGLRLLAERGGCSVEVIDDPRLDLATLATARGPVLAEVALRPNEEDPRFARDWGWLPGVAHSVAVFGEWDGRLWVGDPAIGLETWDRHALTALWTGRAILVSRGGR